MILYIGFSMRGDQPLVHCSLENEPHQSLDNMIARCRMTAKQQNSEYHWSALVPIHGDFGAWFLKWQEAHGRDFRMTCAWIAGCGYMGKYDEIGNVLHGVQADETIPETVRLILTEDDTQFLERFYAAGNMMKTLRAT